jgi:putative SOS response-associated peptidase YedK
LWEWWRAPGEADPQAIESCSLVTGEPNELQSRLHDRMPIILDPASYNAWLDPANEDREQLQAMLVPFPAERMTVRPVGTYVNNARNEGTECLEH